MNKILLWLIMLPRGLWRSIGADVGQLSAILKVKLLLDDRRPLSFGRQQQKKKGRSSVFIGLFLSFFTGIVYTLPLFALRHDRIFSLWVSFTLFLFLLTFMLITDFSNVLINTRDKYIVLPRPVSDRTLLLSRILHIFTYLFRIVVPMSLPGWAAMYFLEGWKGVLWYPVPVFLLVFTALFFVIGLYMLLLRFFSASRFKEMLSGFQIVFSVILFAFYLAPRALGNDAMHTLDTSRFTWARGFPSYWLAATWAWVNPHAAVFPGTLMLSALAVLFPAACLFITVRYLAPKFTERLGSLDESDAGGQSTPAPVSERSGAGYKRWATMLNRNTIAQAGFMMAWMYTGRNRAFRMRIYPTFAYVPLYFVYLLTLDKQSSMQDLWTNLPHSPKHILLLYLCSFVFVQSLFYLTISEQYKAAWIYYAAPMEAPGSVMSGAFKAMWVKYFLPFFAAVSVFVIYLWGPAAIVDVLLAGMNITIYGVLMTLLTNRRFPFSVLEQLGSGGSKFLRGIVTMIIPAALGFGHYASLHILWLKILFLLLSGSLLYYLWDSYANTSWAAMTALEE